MKKILFTLFLALPLIAQDHPRTPAKVWIRRITLVASCAASLGWDTYTTRRAETAGAIESNPLLANAQGRPQWGRFISLKAGACGASAFAQERWHFQGSDWTWTGLNAASAATYTGIGFHNLAISK